MCESFAFVLHNNWFGFRTDEVSNQPWTHLLICALVQLHHWHQCGFPARHYWGNARPQQKDVLQQPQPPRKQAHGQGTEDWSGVNRSPLLYLRHEGYEVKQANLSWNSQIKIMHGNQPSPLQMYTGLVQLQAISAAPEHVNTFHQLDCDTEKLRKLRENISLFPI